MEQQRLLAHLLDSERARGFDLDQAPLLRLTLLRTGEHTYGFIWSFHHLLLDGWSLPLVLREVFTLYEGLRTGQAVELAEEVRLVGRGGRAVDR